MRYVCLWYGTAGKEAWASEQLDEDPLDRGSLLAAEALAPAGSAALLRVRNGKLTVTEHDGSGAAGPLDGFAIIDARDLNDAIRIASRLPSARLGVVEVRAIRPLRSQGR